MIGQAQCILPTPSISFSSSSDALRVLLLLLLLIAWSTELLSTDSLTDYNRLNRTLIGIGLWSESERNRRLGRHEKTNAFNRKLDQNHY